MDRCSNKVIYFRLGAQLLFLLTNLASRCTGTLQSSVMTSQRYRCSFMTTAAPSSSPMRGDRTTHSPLASDSTEGSEDRRGTKQVDVVEQQVRLALRGLAELSLQDYQWRRGVFSATQADRQLRDSLDRIRGHAQEPSYVRPMDAPTRTLGPLGKWEQSSVEWLSQLLDEEGRRAKTIVNQDGKLIRPKDNVEEGINEPFGPLGLLEKNAVEFVETIQRSERERVKSEVFLRPKDMEESIRGPLGEAELAVVRVLKEIEDSERTRMKQSQQRGGAVVRPIDVPGPLGELELAILEICDAEQRRVMERQKNSGKVVRPKDAKVPGRLGEAEQQAYETFQLLSAEEKERLRGIARILQESRPMDTDRSSILGVIETVVVGIVRAPILLLRLCQRVYELLRSSALDDADNKIVHERRESRDTEGSSSSSGTSSEGKS